MNLIKRFFGRATEAQTDSPEQRGHSISVATCALFLEMATIDGEFSDEERGNILSILEKEFQLSHEDAAELIEAAREELKQSIDLWKFSNLINRTQRTCRIRTDDLSQDVRFAIFKVIVEGSGGAARCLGNLLDRSRSITVLCKQLARNIENRFFEFRCFLHSISLLIV